MTSASSKVVKDPIVDYEDNEEDDDDKDVYGLEDEENSQHSHDD